MVLGQGLEDADGVRHAMTGLLGHATSFAQRKLHLGYRQARLLSDCALGKDGSAVRGHEFHYASLIETGNDAPLAEIADGDGNALGTAGGRRGKRHRHVLPRHRFGVNELKRSLSETCASSKVAMPV